MISKGKITAFVGHSGAGKSTILNLIPRFYAPQNGKIIFDGQEINKVSLKSLRNKISFVSQDVILLMIVLRIILNMQIWMPMIVKLKEACSSVAADEFIENLPDKYQTLIGGNGVRLSGGQKQRISIARAIFKNSPIILLDEATSSLDGVDSKKKFKMQYLI